MSSLSVSNDGDSKISCICLSEKILTYYAPSRTKEIKFILDTLFCVLIFNIYLAMILLNEESDVVGQTGLLFYSNTAAIAF